MHAEDLTASVANVLAWYYVLCALLNLGAAAYWTWGRPDRKLADWQVYALAGFSGAYGLAVLIAVSPIGQLPAHVLVAAANLALLGVAVQAALGYRETAASAWAVIGAVFQLLGLVYVFAPTASAPVMPTALKVAIDTAAGPVTFFFSSVVVFAAMLYFRKGFTNPVFIWAFVNVGLLYFGFSLTDHDFRLIVAKEDNVPITMMLVLVGYFTWLAMRKAVINDERIAQGKPPIEADGAETEKTLVWPDLVYIELIAMVICTVILVVWSVVLKAPLEQPANVTETPNPSKAPWYFLGLQEMLVYYDPWIAGVLYPGLIIFGLMAIPFIDFNKQGAGYYTFAQRKFSITVFMFGFIVLWVLMVILGTFLRGPGWNFFGPYMYWDPHLVLPLNNVDLADFFWVGLLGRGKPEAWYVRELPGFLAVIAYLGVLPPLLAKTVFRQFFIKLGFARYMVFAFLVLTMASLPLKMLLRWTFNLKYIIHIDEFFFNI
jgi:hypothetical protein